MKIMFLTCKSFGNDDMISAFQSLGHTVVTKEYTDKEEPDNEEAVKQFALELKTADVDCVFSFNFFPLVALGCKDLGMSKFGMIETGYP